MKSYWGRSGNGERGGRRRFSNSPRNGLGGSSIHGRQTGTPRARRRGEEGLGGKAPLSPEQLAGLRVCTIAGETSKQRAVVYFHTTGCARNEVFPSLLLSTRRANPLTLDEGLCFKV